MGRPRKPGLRKPCGRLRKKLKEDPRLPTALTRTRDFGVTVSQALNPLAGYLAGVMFLRGQLTADHLGRFYSFLQMAPNYVHAIELREHVQHARRSFLGRPTDKRYVLLARALGSAIIYLHELANDRLICPIATLKKTLGKVPLTGGAHMFISSCESQRPKKLDGGHTKKLSQQKLKKSGRY